MGNNRLLCINNKYQVYIERRVLIARAFVHCVFRSGLCNVSKRCAFNHVTRLYDLIYVKLPYEPARKAVCLEE